MQMNDTMRTYNLYSHHTAINSYYWHLWHELVRSNKHKLHTLGVYDRRYHDDCYGGLPILVFRQKQWIMSNNDYDDENKAKEQKEGTHG